MDHSLANTPWAGRIRTIVVPAVATPILFHWYWMAVYVLLDHPFTVSPISRPETWVSIAMLGILGSGVVLVWRLGLSVSPAVTSGGLLVLPWLTPTTEVGGPGYPAVVFVGALLLAVTEWQVRDPGGGEIGKPFEEPVGQYALIAGFAHFILGFGLQIYVRRLQFVDPVYGPSGIVLGLLIHVVTGLVLFTTGALPVIGWARARLVTPAAVTGGWFIWGVYGIWTHWHRFPLGDFAGVQWMYREPHPDYMLQSTVLLVAVLFVAGAEALAHRLAAHASVVSRTG